MVMMKQIHFSATTSLQTPLRWKKHIRLHVFDHNDSFPPWWSDGSAVQSFITCSGLDFNTKTAEQSESWAELLEFYCTSEKIKFRIWLTLKSILVTKYSFEIELFFTVVQLALYVWIKMKRKKNNNFILLFFCGLNGHNLPQPSSLKGWSHNLTNEVRMSVRFMN